MTGIRKTFFIQVFVEKDLERAPFMAAAQILSRRVSLVTGVEQKFETVFFSSLSNHETEKTPDIIVMSLLSSLTTFDQDMSALAAGWKQKIEMLMEQHHCPIFICTIFRHVPRDVERHPLPSRDWVLERIRRINLMAMELSQSLGVNIIDIDRSLTYIGARNIQTDYLLSGRLGTLVVGDVIASVLLQAGFDDIVSPENQQKLHQISGGIHGIVHRLPQWQTKTQADGAQHVRT